MDSVLLGLTIVPAIRKVGEMGMTDQEKVIKGLEICTTRNDICQYKQEPICPYVEHCQKEDYSALQRDALALLKEQEERIKLLEHQLETLTRWRMNAGAFD